MFDPAVWAAVPFHFWSVVLFVFGTMVGSFLNVVIHRLPRNESIVSPPSHCPHCQYSIPWYLNVPLFTWLFLRGKCRNCQAPISVRYFLVELLTGGLFLAAWLKYGGVSPLLALSVCLFLAILLASSFIDIEHFIIPDELTIGGIVVGLLTSLAVPQLQHTYDRAAAMRTSFFGMLIGAGVIYLILRIGKLAFGRQNFQIPEGGLVHFNETSLSLPDQEIPYEDIFYRDGDVIRFHAKTLELPEMCHWNVDVEMSAKELKVGETTYDPATVGMMVVNTESIAVPREAMGFGDVKFMAAIGAFVGGPASVICLMLGSVVGAIISVGALMLRSKEVQGKVPFGPYLALGAVVWMFLPFEWQREAAFSVFELVRIVIPSLKW